MRTRRNFLVSSASVTLAAVFATLGGDRRARACSPWGELVPDPEGILDLPAGCKFCTRCSEAWDRCHADEPALHNIGDGHFVRCHLVEAARP